MAGERRELFYCGNGRLGAEPHFAKNAPPRIWDDRRIDNFGRTLLEITRVED